MTYRRKNDIISVRQTKYIFYYEKSITSVTGAFSQSITFVVEVCWFVAESAGMHLLYFLMYIGCVLIRYFYFKEENYEMSEMWRRIK